MKRRACSLCSRHLWPFFCLEEVFDFTSFFLTFTHKPLWTAGECKIAALFWSDGGKAAKASKNGTQPTWTPVYTASKISFMLNYRIPCLVCSSKSSGQHVSAISVVVQYLCVHIYINAFERFHKVTMLFSKLNVLAKIIFVYCITVLQPKAITVNITWKKDLFDSWQCMINILFNVFMSF